MVFGLPARDEVDWDIKLNDSINAVKATADGAAAKANNLSDLTNATTARTNLGLGNSATKNTGTTTGTVAAGDDSRITGAAQKAANLSDLADAPTARTNLGLGNVNNTSDVNKPVSTAQQTALDGKAGLAATKNVFTGMMEINGGFTNSFDTVLWVAGAVRNNPTLQSQGLYIQHRVQGTLGGGSHDGGASELRITSGTTTFTMNGFEATAQVGSTGNSLPDLRSITANMVFTSGVTGSITDAAILRAQAAPTPGSMTINRMVSVWAEAQTQGATNWNVYAPTGNSLFGGVVIDNTAGVSKAITLTTAGVNRWLINTTGTESGSNTGADLQVLARTDAGGSNFTPFVITRSSGLTQINNGLKVTGNVGFFGGTPAAKPTVSGSKGANAALTSLMTALVSLGLVADTTT